MAEAAQVALQGAEGLPASKGQERAGFALAACEIAYRSLRESGLPASRWLASEAMQKPLAAYNTALAMFIFESSETLAGGPATLSVQTPLGPRIVAARLAADSHYKAGNYKEWRRNAMRRRRSPRFFLVSYLNMEMLREQRKQLQLLEAA